MSHNNNELIVGDGPIVIDYWAHVKANLANATGLRESQIVIVSKCKCCQVRPIPARTGDPRQDGVLAVCRECAKDLCPGPDVKRYNELVAKFGW